MRRTPANSGGKFCPRRLSARRKCTWETSLAGSSWRDHQTQPKCLAIFAVGCPGTMSVLTHGHHEVLPQFQGSHYFARNQRLRLKAPGWRVLDFHGNSLKEDELERQREKIRKGPLVVPDREHPFAEDLITDEAGVVDAQLPVLTKMLRLVDALMMGGSYELIEKLWAQFVLSAGPAKFEVAWTRDEVLVSSVNFRNHFVSFPLHIVVLLSVNHRYWNAAPKFVARGWLV